MSKVLHIVRGIPGSGKSTLAKTLGTVYEADNHFLNADGRYHWVADQVPTAHAVCQSKVDAGMRRGDTPLVVSNTFIAKKHMAPYLVKAQAYGYEVQIHDLFDGGCTDMQLCHRNVHSVPLATIERMRRQYEH